MNKMASFIMLVIFSSCSSTKVLHSNQAAFWQSLQSICGQAFEGTVISAPATDTTFKNKTLLMHVRACEDSRIRVPFMVGDDRSRTWVFTKNGNGLQLQHDHRHRDGSADSITFYGGHTSNSGTATAQYFPADEQTVKMLPLAGANIWWVEMVPGKYFTYNLRRLGTDRLFSIRFDLTRPVAASAAPWGWKE
jgi:hypothetical protein